jgi:hypothetical protein
VDSQFKVIATRVSGAEAQLTLRSRHGNIRPGTCAALRVFTGMHVTPGRRPNTLIVTCRERSLRQHGSEDLLEFLGMFAATV